MQQLDFGDNCSEQFISILSTLPALHLKYLNLSSKISNVNIYTPENLIRLRSKLRQCPKLKKINVTMYLKYNNKNILEQLTQLDFDIMFTLGTPMYQFVPGLGIYIRVEGGS